MAMTPVAIRNSVRLSSVLVRIVMACPLRSAGLALGQ